MQQPSWKRGRGEGGQEQKPYVAASAVQAARAELCELVKATVHGWWGGGGSCGCASSPSLLAGYLQRAKDLGSEYSSLISVGS